MSRERDSVVHTVIVATVLCIVCSLLVSAAHVTLLPRQLANREQSRQKNILVLTGLYDENRPIDETFEQIETRIVDLETGQFVPADEIDPESFNQRDAARDPALSVAIPADQDIAGIKRREKYSFVYLVKEGDEIVQFVLPVYGTGLWSTMYAYLALDADGSTIRGITFYEQGETAGLGGEIENKDWRAGWSGKQVYDDKGSVAFKVIKGTVDTSRPEAELQVDGISGATITANGVTDTIHYWLGPNGFGPFLERHRSAASPNDTTLSQRHVRSPAIEY